MGLSRLSGVPLPLLCAAVVQSEPFGWWAWRGVTALVDGCSVRSTTRMTGVARGTILRLLAEVGKACAAYQSRVIQNVPAQRVQVDEIWSFVGCKHKQVTVEKIERSGVCGDPEPKHISTSYVERQNITMRMNMRRFTRLTNAFSKKIEDHMHQVALLYMRVTPAMAAGVTGKLWSIHDIVATTAERRSLVLDAA